MSVVASDTYTLSDLTDQLLAAAADALATTDAGTPDLAYVATETPAFDCCPALIVTVPKLAEQDTEPTSPSGAPALRVIIAASIIATWRIYILRCAATGPLGIPSAVDTEMVAHETQQDMWIVWNGIRQAIRDGELFERCLGVFFDAAEPITEQGGCVGWTITLRANIPGIPA